MPLPEFSDITELRSWLGWERKRGHRIGLVPTMGALHEGHLSLVDHARRHAQSVVMSIFVNPLQFGPHEDYGRYPRDLDRDRSLAEDRGVHALFVPTVEVMYPPGAETRVVPGTSAEHWEGAVRPGHFAGVLTVVAKLFHIVQPDVAVFGQKDIQQAVLIRQMARDLDWPLELIVAPTVREADGLALSSRNAYLDPAQRREALTLSSALRAADRAWRAGEQDTARLEATMRDAFRLHPSVSVDYIAIVDERLAPTARAPAGTILAVAARVGTTRLLDNLILGVEFP
jgi:pantoate--beta-alanine ligase